MVNIEGRNPVFEALKNDRRIFEILINKDSKGEVIKEIIILARKKNIPLKKISIYDLDKKSKSYNHQGIIALAEEIKLYTPLDIIDFARKRHEDPFIIILDHLQDPHNFGAIIRTAYAAGAHGIIFPDKRSVDITPLVEKSSAGAINYIKMAKVKNINYTIRDLKDEEIWVAGADMAGKDIFSNTDLKGPIAIIIGNEGTGLRRLVKKNCDFLVKIPMKGHLGSLNASVASGILMYELLRQRMLD